MDEINFKSIGMIRTPFPEPVGVPLQPVGAVGVGARIELRPEYEAGLKDIAGFSHLILIYHLHLARGYNLITTPFLDTQEHGIFATRSPHRPNGIGMSIVRLVRVAGPTLFIEEVDIVDGTPLLDIKPYVPQFDVRETDRIGWFAGKVDNVYTARADDRFLRPQAQLLVLVRGVGEVGSAVAHRLFRAGYSVVLHCEGLPSTSRRLMAFTDAVFDGVATLDGLSARRVDDIAQLPVLLAERSAIPLLVGPLDGLSDTLKPQVMVDARMRKREQPGVQLNQAALTIGIGSNYVAVVTTDLAIESGQGDDLGRVLRSGSPRPLEGEPPPIVGYGRERFVYAPHAGDFQTNMCIGECVQKGDIVARIGEHVLVAPLDGVLRGLTRDGVPVSVGTKIIEIDPRGEQAIISGISERSSRIAAGVLSAIQQSDSAVQSR